MSAKTNDRIEKLETEMKELRRMLHETIAALNYLKKVQPAPSMFGPGKREPESFYPF